VRTDPVELFVELAALTSPPGQERMVADHVTSFVREHGLDVLEDDAACRLGGSTGNLVVQLPPRRAGTPVFFCAHLDTVPVEGPVQPVVAEGIVRSDGRTILGADNKASVAAMLVALSRLVSETREHAGVEFVFTPMEEVGCKGASEFDTTRLASRFGFVYDHEGPIGTYVGSAPAGYLLRLDFRGRAAHAGIDPEKGRSAIQAAGRAIVGLTFGRLSDSSTLNAGVIQGGTAHNVVAEQCSLSIDVRARTYGRGLELIDEIRDVAARAASDCGCTVEIDVAEKYRDYHFDGTERVVELARRAFAAVGATMEAVDAGGGADASIFNARGVSCLNVGSGMRSIHTREESIAIDDLYKLVELTLAIVDAAISAE
jgi:tripeptide aminopeptidase